MLVSKTKPCTCKIGIGFTASAVCSLLICGQLIITQGEAWLEGNFLCVTWCLKVIDEAKGSAQDACLRLSGRGNSAVRSRAEVRCSVGSGTWGAGNQRLERHFLLGW